MNDADVSAWKIQKKKTFEALMSENIAFVWLV